MLAMLGMMKLDIAELERAAQIVKGCSGR